jgi:hypothetical protein
MPSSFFPDYGTVRHLLNYFVSSFSSCIFADYDVTNTN